MRTQHDVGKTRPPPQRKSTKSKVEARVSLGRSSKPAPSGGHLAGGKEGAGLPRTDGSGTTRFELGPSGPTTCAPGTQTPQHTAQGPRAPHADHVLAGLEPPPGQRENIRFHEEQAGGTMNRGEEEEPVHWPEPAPTPRPATGSPSWTTASGQTPASPDDVRVLPVLAFALFPLPVHHRGVHVGRREGVRLIEERDDTQQDGPGGVGGVASAGAACSLATPPQEPGLAPQYSWTHPGASPRPGDPSTPNPVGDVAAAGFCLRPLGE